MKALATERGDLIFAETEPFGQDAVVPGIGRDQTFLETAFDLDAGELSDPVQLNRGWAVMYLEKVEPPRDQLLAEVEDQVKEEIRRRKQNQMAVDRMAAAKAEIDDGKTLEQVAQEMGLTVEEAGEFGPRSAIPGLGYNPQVVKAAFSLPQGQIGGPYESRQGAVLIEVTERTTMDPQAFEAAKEQTREQLESEKLNRLRSSLVRERRRVLEVRYSQQLQQQLSQQTTSPAGTLGS